MVLIWTGLIDSLFLQETRAKLIVEVWEGLQQRKSNGFPPWLGGKKSSARREREEVHVH